MRGIRGSLILAILIALSLVGTGCTTPTTYCVRRAALVPIPAPPQSQLIRGDRYRAGHMQQDRPTARREHYGKKHARPGSDIYGHAAHETIQR